MLTLYSFFLNIYILFFFFNFTILYWFCHVSTWIRHRYTCVPHPEPSSLLPPRTISLCRPSAPAPRIQYRASNLDWQLVSYTFLLIVFWSREGMVWDFGISTYKLSYIGWINNKVLLYITGSYVQYHTQQKRFYSFLMVN